MIGLAEVVALTGLSRATIYRMRRAGQFPMPVKVARRRIAWKESEIETWLAERPRVDLATPAPAPEG